MQKDNILLKRKKYKKEMLSHAFSEIASVIKPFFEGKQSDEALLSIEQIIEYYGFIPPDRLENNTDIENTIDYMLRPSGIMKRKITLTNDWYKNSSGAILAKTKENNFVAILPHGIYSYRYFDKRKAKYVKLNKKTNQLLESEAYCFYLPLPEKKISISDLIFFLIKLSKPIDYIIVAISTFLMAMIGMLIPLLNNYLFSKVIYSDNKRLLLAVSIMLLSVNFSIMLMNVCKTLFIQKIVIKSSVPLQAAIYMRILRLPPNIFNDYMAGDMAMRVSSLSNLCNMLFDTIFSVGLTSIFSITYIIQMMKYTKSLVIPSIIVLVLNVVLSIYISNFRLKNNTNKLRSESSTQGMTYSLFSGIKKIKLTGCEERAFSKWIEAYEKVAHFTYNPPKIVTYGSTILLSISLISTIVIYFISSTNNISVANYYTFNSIYGLISGAFLSLISISSSIAMIHPIIDMGKPILQNSPEQMSNVKQVSNLTGNIEFSNVTFKYNENSPLVLDHLSFQIEKNEYVAIVGKTGCGKSTIVRLLLGFEKPQSGSIFYDKIDIATVDLQSLRKNIGVVSQNGKLFPGTIFQNITISAPSLSLEDAMEAAERAGIKDDILSLPMGFNTVLGEDGGGLSGGQKQRIMIARAIANKPKILIFDEATSALDNINQKNISNSLDELDCTRIVIAHRLSTIKKCDRILVIENGQITSSGSFDYLMNNNDYFLNLVKRQSIKG
ncbi:MAG: ATP-binding cassette domain-containing protein [Eubacteriales bacterium]|nr:ATP-binding cassette domain-containing protein [Eubacteriales bacterium]